MKYSYLRCWVTQRMTGTGSLKDCPYWVICLSEESAKVHILLKTCGEKRLVIYNSQYQLAKGCLKFYWTFSDLTTKTVAMKGREILWGIYLILFKENIFNYPFSYWKHWVILYISFEQVFLGLENLCENFNNILENAFNRGNLYYKNDINFELK